MATPFRESPYFLRGRCGERLVERWLQLRGWWVIPSYDYAGDQKDKAPRMSGLDSALVIPDMDIAKAGLRRWAEVKTKKAPNLFRKTQTLEHGIDRRHYEHYRRVQDVTGAHVWIFIVEEDSQTILAEALDTLEPFKRVGPSTYGKGGMVNWPRDRFSINVHVKNVPGLAS